MIMIEFHDAVSKSIYQRLCGLAIRHSFIIFPTALDYTFANHQPH